MRFGAVMAIGLALVACKGNDDIGGTDNPDLVRDTLMDFEKTEACEVYVTSEGLECPDFEGVSRYLMANAILEDNGTLGGEFYYVGVANTPFLANEDWKSSGAHADGDGFCTVGAGMSGTWVEGGSAECPNCDYTLTYSLTYAASLSNCPAGLNADIGDSFNRAVDAYMGITVDEDGNATAYDTAQQWAPNGIGDDTGVIVWSEPSCAWFGSSECT